MVLEQVDFGWMFSWFAGVGGFDIILPFLLIFTIVFALMEKVQLFGEKKKNVHVIVALVAAAFVIAQPEIVFLIQGFIPNVSMFILIILMGLLVMGMFGLKGDTKWPWGIAVIVAVVVILWSLSAATSAYYWPFFDILTSQDIAWLIAIGVFILVMWLIVKEPGNPDKPGKLLEKFWKKIND